MRINYLLTPTLIASCILATGCSDDDQKDVTSVAKPGTLGLCTEIASQFHHGDTVITEAKMISAGNVEYNTTESYVAPEHCVVTGYMNERTGQGISGETTYAIGFEMRLPKDWNGRFYYQANGGLDGTVHKAVGRLVFSAGEDLTALNKGFAVISSDAGHSSPTPLFGFDHQARLDYGYNAVSELTPMAKSLIETAYGKQPDKSYFGGCSNGGRHAMVAAARHAEMYDGIIAGNPGFHLPQAASAQMYGVQQYSTLVNYNEDGSDILATLQTAITQDEFVLISEKVLAQCDVLDGVVDGMVANIEACQIAFNLNTDVPTCTGERDNTCLTANQKQVLNNIMSGPHHSNTGAAIYSDFYYDAGISSSDWFGWEYEMALTRDPGAVGFVFSSPPTPVDNSELGSLEFIQSFDLENDIARIYSTTDYYQQSGNEFMTPPDETNLATLRDRGSKMIVFHGTSDAVFSSSDSINWYNGVDDMNSGNAKDFTRLFLVPGMGHCGRGPTADKFDMVDAIVNWVEQGVAPDSVIASVRSDNAELPSDWSTSRTRALCPYPQYAKYNGTGDIEDANSFTCVAPE